MSAKNDRSDKDTAIVKVGLLELRLQSKIKELGALSKSMEKAVDQNKSRIEDGKLLIVKLRDLSSLKQKYADLVEAFNISFMLQSPDKTAEINNKYQDVVDAYYCQKVEAERLIQRLKEENVATSVGIVEFDLEPDVVSKLDIKAKKKTKAESMVSNDSISRKSEPEMSRQKLILVKRCCMGIVIVILFYSFLGLVIQVSLSKEVVTVDVTKKTRLWQTDNTTCGADGFMMRDGVCDDASNIAKCLFDGGDCCKENKDKTLCGACTCNLTVNQVELVGQFKDLQIKPLIQGGSNLDPLQNMVEVQDVVSTKVCAKICLEHQKANELNAWHFKANLGICHCGWIHSAACPEKMMMENWRFDVTSGLPNDTTFVQLAKTVSCDCLVTGFLIISDMSEESKVDFGNENPTTPSLWQCLELCRLYDDCAWVSWKNEASGECKLLQNLPANKTRSKQQLMVDSDWMSSSKNCSTVGGHFEKFFAKGESYHFTCPSNGMSSSSSVQNSIITVGTELENSANFLVFIHGTSVVVLKPDPDHDEDVLECSHSILPPVNQLSLITGGILTSDTDTIAVTVCGGQLAEPNHDVNVDMCTILSGKQPSDFKKTVTLSASGDLNFKRIEPATLVIDNGRNLWVTGGFDSKWESVLTHTEFVALLDSNSSEINLTFKTNLAGPELPVPLFHHCLEKVSPEFAILAGGRASEEEGQSSLQSTWSVDIRTMSWKEEAPLLFERFKHACGVVQLGNQVKLIVVAGGIGLDHKFNRHSEALKVTQNGDLLFADQWEAGPSLPITLTEAASASLTTTTTTAATTTTTTTTTTSDHQKQGSLFIVGESAATLSTVILKLSCSMDSLDLLDPADHCSWTRIDYELKSNSRWLVQVLPQVPMVRRGILDARDCVEDLRDDESLLMLTTGWNRHHAMGDTLTFVVHSETNQLTWCQPPLTQSMQSLTAATGGVLTFTNHPEEKGGGMPIVCSGDLFDRVLNDKCFQIGIETSTEVAIMRAPRMGAASTTIFNGTALWVTGGHDSTALDTTELLTMPMVAALSLSENGTNLPKLKQGPTLPMKMAYHCLEMVNSNVAILYGGTELTVDSPAYRHVWTTDNLGNLDKEPEVVFQSLNDNSNLWQPQAFMKQGHAFHACGVLQLRPKEFVVVAAGGEDEIEVSTDNVEFLGIVEHDNNVVVVRNEWKEGPRLPTTLMGASSATTEDRSTLFIAGGLVTYSPLYSSTAIYSLRCSMTGFCWWTRDAIELKITRDTPVALIVPSKTKVAEIEIKCESHQIGDGVCDMVCEYDGGDCCSGALLSSHECYGDWCSCHGTGGTWVDGCFYLVGDKFCDGENNNKDCNFDNGDCCREPSNCFSCYGEECLCNQTGMSHCADLSNCPESLFPNFVADTYCDDSLNIEECLFDGGDCCLQEVETTYCTICECMSLIP